MAERTKSGADARQFRRNVIRALEKSGLVVARNKFTSGYLGHYGFAPATFIDVGVHRGTPELYELFRSSSLVLIDPVPDVASFCEQWLSDPSRNARLLNYALGAAPGRTTMTFSGPMSSLLKRRAVDHMATDKTIDVEIRRLDDVIDEFRLEPPFGIKIDTEGYELEVLRGARRTLSRTDFVIAEASTRHRFEGSYLFAELIAEMAAAGFALADVLSMPSHARYFDCLFIRADNPILFKHKLGA